MEKIVIKSEAKTCIHMQKAIEHIACLSTNFWLDYWLDINIMNTHHEHTSQHPSEIYAIVGVFIFKPYNFYRSCVFWPSHKACICHVFPCALELSSLS